MPKKANIKINEFKLLQGINLVSYLKSISFITCSENNSILFIQESEKNTIQNISTLFDKLEIPYEFGTDKEDMNFLKMTCGEINPKITIPYFLKMIQTLYLTNKNSDISELQPLCNHIVSSLCSQIRVIANSDHDPLAEIVKQISSDVEFDHISTVFDELLNNQNWANFIHNNSNSFSFLSVELKTWLHLIRHPTKNMENFTLFINKFGSNNDKKDFLLTEIPLITDNEDKINNIQNQKTEFIDNHLSFLYAITLPEIIDDTKKNSNTLDEIKSKLTNPIISYWFGLSSLILRNINYTLLKFSNLSLDGLTSEKIKFYDYLKPKLINFTDSCYNPYLIESFKLIEASRRHKTHQIFHRIEFYLYNRGIFLERQFKEAEQQHTKDSSNKIKRKRYNRKKRRLYEYFNLILNLYQPFLNEIAELKLASGKYSSIAKIISLDKNVKEKEE